MRLTEGLIKVIFAKAIESGKVDELNAAFRKHLDMENTFQKVKDEHGGSSWKKVSVQGYQCYDFITKLPASDSHPEEMAIHRILHEVWPEDQASSTGLHNKKKRKHKDPVPDAENQCFIKAFCNLWTLFAEVSTLMRCKDIHHAGLSSFPERCRQLGARWCLLLPSNRCNSHYLHTIMMHAGQFQKSLLDIGLTIGMLENSGAERRHTIGKLQYKRTLCQAVCSGRPVENNSAMYQGALACENRTAYYTLRGTLIWQFGTDMITWELAVLKKQARAAGGRRYHADRTRQGSGWDVSSSQFQSVYAEAAASNPFLPTDLDTKMQSHLESCKNRDTFDEVFTTNAEVFSEAFRDQLDDESAPPMTVDGLAAADEPTVFENGSVAQSLNYPRAGGDDSDSDSTGSSDRSDLSVAASGSASVSGSASLSSGSDDGIDEDSDLGDAT
jgi:hypothetical protein